MYFLKWWGWGSVVVVEIKIRTHLPLLISFSLMKKTGGFRNKSTVLLGKRKHRNLTTMLCLGKVYSFFGGTVEYPFGRFRYFPHRRENTDTLHLFTRSSELSS